MTYKDLEKYFTSPKNFGPMYKNIKRIPRKLKKKVKSVCGIHWNLCTNDQRLWVYLDTNNNDYKRFIIKQICKYYE